MKAAGVCAYLQNYRQPHSKSRVLSVCLMTLENKTDDVCPRLCNVFSTEMESTASNRKLLYASTKNEMV
jgi:hypothetical protein